MRKQPQWQTVKQAADKIGCSRQAIYDAISRGKIVSSEAYGKTLVPKPCSYVPDKAHQNNFKKSA